MREPRGRPGPGRLGFGARAGSSVVGRMFRKPRRTLAGGEPSGLGGSFPGAAQVGDEGPGEA